MTPRPPPRSRHFRVALGIGLLHALLIGGWLTRPAPRLREVPPSPRLATLRLVRAPAPPAPAAAPVSGEAAAGARRPRPTARRPAPMALPRAESVPAAGTISPRLDTAVAEAPAAGASAPAPAIEIPTRGLARGTLHPPALDDPRANRAPESPTERFARAIGSDERLVEERRGEGRHRVRQGTRCLDVKVARDAEIDPYNQNYRPATRLVGDCNER